MRSPDEPRPGPAEPPERLPSSEVALQALTMGFLASGIVGVVGLAVAVALRGLGGLSPAFAFPIGAGMLGLGLTRRRDRGTPRCGRCGHLLPPQEMPERCGECGRWLQAPGSVRQDGRRAPNWWLVAAGTAILLWPLVAMFSRGLGLDRWVPNRVLIALVRSDGEGLGRWQEINRRMVLGELAAPDVDEIAGIAVGNLAADRPGFVTFHSRVFLEGAWTSGSLTPQRQAECVRLAYRLELVRRDGRLVLVASMSLYPRTSPSDFQRLALDTVTVDGVPWRPIRQVLAHEAVPYAQPGSLGRLELDLGELPDDAGTVELTGFVLNSLFARGNAEWDPEDGSLTLDLDILAAPFTLRAAPATGGDAGR